MKRMLKLFRNIAFNSNISIPELDLITDFLNFIILIGLMQTCCCFLPHLSSRTSFNILLTSSFLPYLYDLRSMLSLLMCLWWGHSSPCLVAIPQFHSSFFFFSHWLLLYRETFHLDCFLAPRYMAKMFLDISFIVTFFTHSVATTDYYFSSVVYWECYIKLLASVCSLRKPLMSLSLSWF